MLKASLLSTLDTLVLRQTMVRPTALSLLATASVALAAPKLDKENTGPETLPGAYIVEFDEGAVWNPCSTISPLDNELANTILVECESISHSGRARLRDAHGIQL